ncbi:hypothetical protein Hdeb2414_s0001g00008371 [Helianthus debilis subsp. tardiflorus]
MEEYGYDGPAVIVQVLCPTSLILLKFFELTSTLFEDAVCTDDGSVVLKISNLSMAIYINRCFSYGGCSSTIVATSYPSLHRILD